MKRALIVAFHFAPESTSGTHRSLHFARGLVDGGVDVTVLTRSFESIHKADESLTDVFPWPDRIVRVAAEDTLLSRVVPAVKRVVLPPGREESRTEMPGGGTIAAAKAEPAIPGAPAPTQHFARARLLLDRFEKHPDVHKGWFRPAIRAGRELFHRESFDVVLASGPPWTCLRVGAALATEHGVPFVADFRDPWTRRSGRDHFSRGALFDWLRERMEARVIASSELVLTNSPGVAEAFLERYARLGPAGVATILNGSDARRRSRETPWPDSPGLVARHFGSLYGGRRIAPLARAAARRGKSRGAGAWRVEQFGDVPRQADFEGLSAPARAALSIRPAVPFTTAVEMMHEPGLLVVIQPAAFERQVPTKLYDYLCTGNPILVLAPESSATWAVAERFDRCFRADPEDVAGIGRILETLEERKEAGTLSQVATVDDTAALTKRAISAEFLRRVGQIAG
jgi:hypothetical protein